MPQIAIHLLYGSISLMRVLTGKAKGKKLKVPSSKKVRPTTSRVKKSIFDKLGNIDGLKVLDLFAGSGNLGIEALSKNALSVTFVEKDRTASRLINENILNCGFDDCTRVINSDYKKALKFLERKEEKFDLIFIDPPYEIYDKVSFIDMLQLSVTVLNSFGTVVMEHNKELFLENFDFDLETRKYGGTNITFFWRKN